MLTIFVLQFVSFLIKVLSGVEVKHQFKEIGITNETQKKFANLLEEVQEGNNKNLMYRPDGVTLILLEKLCTVWGYLLNPLYTKDYRFIFNIIIRICKPDGGY